MGPAIISRVSPLRADVGFYLFIYLYKKNDVAVKRSPSSAFTMEEFTEGVAIARGIRCNPTPNSPPPVRQSKWVRLGTGMAGYGQHQYFIFRATKRIINGPSLEHCFLSKQPFLPSGSRSSKKCQRSTLL